MPIELHEPPCWKAAETIEGLDDENVRRYTGAWCVENVAGRFAERTVAEKKEAVKDLGVTSMRVFVRDLQGRVWGVQVTVIAHVMITFTTDAEPAEEVEVGVP